MASASRTSSRAGLTLRRYNAPEVPRQETTQISPENLHKCDIWAFGLLVWEILKDGGRYFDSRWMADTSIIESVGVPEEIAFENFDFSLLRGYAVTFLRQMPNQDSFCGDFAKAALRALLSNTLQIDPVARRSNLKAFPIMTTWK